MVTGISSNVGTSQLFTGAFGRGSTTFSLNENNPRNLLQLDPVFEKPSTELRVAERRRTKDNPFLDNNEANKKNPLTDQVQASTFLGDQQLSRLRREQNQPISLGGSLLEAEGGSVTLKSGDTSIKIGASDDARIVENNDGSLTVVNKSSDTSVTFQQGDDINVSGEGTARITGIQRNVVTGGGATAERVTSKTISADAGTTLSVSETSRGNTSLRKAGSAKSIELGRKTNISIKGSSGELFTFTNDQGRSITFGAGDTGTIVTNQDGSITIKNETTGRTERFSTSESLDTGGNARAVLRNRGGATLTFEGAGTGQFTSTETGGLALQNTSTVESTTIQARNEPPQPGRRVRIKTFTNPETSTANFIQNQLLSKPEQQAREARKAQHTEETKPEKQDDTLSDPSQKKNKKDKPFAAFQNEQKKQNPFSALKTDKKKKSPFKIDEKDKDENPFRTGNSTEDTANTTPRSEGPIGGSDNGNRSSFLSLNPSVQGFGNSQTSEASGESGSGSTSELNFFA